MRLRSAIFVVPSALALGVLAPAGIASAADPPPAGAYASVDVPRADYTEVAGINNWGAIVGTYGDDEGQHGFIKVDGHITTVDAPHTGSTVLTSINDAGTVSGYYLTDYGGRTHGFLRDASGHFTVLEDPAVEGGTPSGTVATGVNDLGTVVGYSFSTDGDTTSLHGFVWSWGHFRTYDAPGSSTVGPMFAGTQLYGISNLGVMVGRTTFLEDGVPPDQAIVVTRTGSSTYADPLTDGAGFCGYTHYVAVNDLGTIAGNSGNGCQNVHTAWLTGGSAFTPLAYPGAAKTVVSGLNDWGTVVGTWTDGAGQEHGFVLRGH